MPPNFDPLLSRLPEPARTSVGAALGAPSWITIRRALSALTKCPSAVQGPETALYILSTFTVESIEPALQLGLRCLPCRPALEFAPLNTVEQQLLDPHSALYSKRGLANVILWRADELLPDLRYPFSSGGLASLKAKCRKLEERISAMIHAYAAAGSTPLFVSTLPVPPLCSGVVLNSQSAAGVSGAIAQVNMKIHELGSLGPRVKVLDLNRWSAGEGSAGYDMQMDFLGRQPFTTAAAVSLGLFLARNLRPLIVPRRKVLAVDLDDTLWGGILGEDGVRNLKLGHDFPGNVYLRIQRELLELKQQGVLLVLISKNNEADARQAMETLPDMLLKWDDFICHNVNFEHKYLNLRQAAADLGLGLDSFAFLDDSDYERAQVKTFLPEVRILNQRKDALHMLDSLLRSDAFDAYQVTEEDRMRHQDYQFRAARNAVPQDGAVEEFLASLELRAKVEPVNPNNIDRVVQMLAKTNQFNLTTRRHRLEDVHRLLSPLQSVGLTLRLADKFGDQGIVGVLLAAPQEDGTSMYVDSFLVSCRAIGRGVEDVLWASLVNRVAANGVKRIYGDYIPTAKNPLVAGLYPRLGLKQCEQTPAGTRFVLEQTAPGHYPDYIAVEEAA